VAYNVALHYFGVLRAEADLRVAEEAVRRAEVDLRDAKNFLRRGTGIRNEVLRAEVFLAESKLELIKTRTERGVASRSIDCRSPFRPRECINMPRTMSSARLPCSQAGENEHD